MIKDKAAKKDPDKFIELRNKMMAKSHSFQKYSKKPGVKKKLVKGWNGMTLTDLASEASMNVDDLFEAILGLEVNTDWLKDEHQELNAKFVIEVATRLHFKVQMVKSPKAEVKEKIDKDARRSPPPDEKDMVVRPPVVTIMGHIDHGKTSLLDYLRKSSIVAGEAGGITQHIGAFSVQLEGLKKRVTIIDTPGHAAFTAMRTRGAVSTDIVILIIDSCEGVLEQTRESLRIIRQARVPFIVALNKIDKVGSNLKAVAEQLKQEGVLLEDQGGEVQSVPISALKGTNVRQLVEAVLAQAELLELKGDPKGNVEGVVIEGQVEAGLGKTATVLLSRGTLKPSQFLVCGKSWAKVRLLLGDSGEKLKSIGPSGAAKVAGWRGDDVPGAGDEVLGVATENRAKEVVAWRTTQHLLQQGERELEMIDEQRAANREAYIDYRTKKRDSGWVKPKFGTLDFHVRVKEAEAKPDTPVVAVVVKGDVDGSVEAILSCLDTYSSEDVLLDIVHFGVGPVSEKDVTLAQTFNAIVYAFNTDISEPIVKQAGGLGVAVKRFDVIYHLIGDLRAELGDRMPPVEVEDVVGRATVVQQFQITEKKEKVAVAGCRVVTGRLPRDGTYRVSRGGATLFEGGLASLKHQKDEVSEINQNQECGLRVEDKDIEFQAGDIVTCFSKRMEPSVCNWDPGF